MIYYIQVTWQLQRWVESMHHPETLAHGALVMSDYRKGDIGKGSAIQLESMPSEALGRF